MPNNEPIPVQEALRQVLADTYALYGKTHGYHWNVTGPSFPSLHTLFEKQYTDLWNALDDLAERIRGLGSFAPQGFSAISAMSSITGGDPKNSSLDMIKDLLQGHLQVISSIRVAFQAAVTCNDDVTQSLMSDRQSAHEKQVWVLRATSNLPA